MYNFLAFILLFTSVFVYCKNYKLGKPANLNVNYYEDYLDYVLELEYRDLNKIKDHNTHAFKLKESKCKSLWKEKLNFAAQIEIFGKDDSVPLPSLLDEDNQNFKEEFNAYLSKNVGAEFTYREFEVPINYDDKCKASSTEMVILSAGVKTVDPSSSVYLWNHNGGPVPSDSSIKKKFLLPEIYSKSNQVFLDHRGTGAFNSFMSKEFRILEEYRKLNESDPNSFMEEVMSDIAQNSKYISSHHQACDVLYVNNIMSEEFSRGNKIKFIGHSYGGVVATKLNNILSSLGNSYYGKDGVLQSIVYHSPALLFSSQYESIEPEMSEEVIQNFITYSLSYNASKAKLEYKSSYRKKANKIFQLINNKFQSDGYTEEEIEKFCSIVTGQEESKFSNELYGNVKYYIFSLNYVQRTNDGHVFTNPGTPDNFTSIADFCSYKFYNKMYESWRTALDSLPEEILPSRINLVDNKSSRFPKNINDASYLLFQFNHDDSIPTKNVDDINQYLIDSYDNSEHNKDAPNVTYYKYLNESTHCLLNSRVTDTINRFLNNTSLLRQGTFEKIELDKSRRSNVFYKERSKHFYRELGSWLPEIFEGFFGHDSSSSDAGTDDEE